MNKILLGSALSAATLLSAFTAFAQQPEARDAAPRSDAAERAPGRRTAAREAAPHRAARAEDRLEALKQRHGLTDDQVAAVRRILTEARAEHEAIPRGPEHREAHRAIRERSKQAISAVLTPEQRDRAEARREARLERRNEGRGHGDGDCEHRGRGRGHGFGHGEGRGPAKPGKR